MPSPDKVNKDYSNMGSSSATPRTSDCFDRFDTVFDEEMIQIWPALWSAGGTRPAGISLSPGGKDVRCSAMSLQKCLKLGCHASTQLLADVERVSAVS